MVHIPMLQWRNVHSVTVVFLPFSLLWSAILLTALVANIRNLLPCCWFCLFWHTHVLTSGENQSKHKRTKWRTASTSGMFCSNVSLALGCSDFSDLEADFVSESASRTGRPMVTTRSLCSRCCLSPTYVDVWHHQWSSTAVLTRSTCRPQASDRAADPAKFYNSSPAVVWILFNNSWIQIVIWITPKPPVCC